MCVNKSLNSCRFISCCRPLFGLLLIIPFFLFILSYAIQLDIPSREHLYANWLGTLNIYSLWSWETVECACILNASLEKNCQRDKLSHPFLSFDGPVVLVAGRKLFSTVRMKICVFDFILATPFHHKITTKYADATASQKTVAAIFGYLFTLLVPKMHAPFSNTHRAYKQGTKQKKIRTNDTFQYSVNACACHKIIK